MLQSPMSVSFEKGDIFATPKLQALAHGCNNYGAMGAGIAVLFRTKFKGMFESYRELCEDGTLKLGDVFIWKDTDGTFVFNLITQDSVATLNAIRTSLTTACKRASRMGIKEIALPAVGAGLGGLKWPDVKKVIIEVGSKTSVNLRVCETFVEGSRMKIKSYNKPETIAKYRKKNKEALRIQEREYYQNNKEKILLRKKLQRKKLK